MSCSREATREDQERITMEFIKEVYLEYTELQMSMVDEVRCMKDATDLIRALRKTKRMADRIIAERIIDVIKQEIMAIPCVAPCEECGHKDNPVNMFCPECKALENYRGKIFEMLSMRCRSDDMGHCTCGKPPEDHSNILMAIHHYWYMHDGVEGCPICDMRRRSADDISVQHNNAVANKKPQR